MLANRKGKHTTTSSGKPTDDTNQVLVEYELYDERDDPANQCSAPRDASLGLPVLAAEQVRAATAAGSVPMECTADDDDGAAGSESAAGTLSKPDWSVGASVSYSGPCARDLPDGLGPVPLYTADRAKLDEAAAQQLRGGGWDGGADAFGAGNHAAALGLAPGQRAVAV